MRKLSVLVVPTLSLTLGACAPMATSFKPVEELSNKNSAAGIEVPGGPDSKPELACLDDAVDYVLETDIVSFGLFDKNNVKVGARAPIGGVPVGIELGVSYARSELQTTMSVYQPLHGPNPVAVAPGLATHKETGFDIGVDVSIINVDFGTFRTTPLGQLGEEAIRNNLGKLLPNIKDSWTTHVSQVYSDSEIEIPVGYTAGVQLGDEFEIYDVDYIWKGLPCQSPLRIVKPKMNFPIATAVISQVPSSDTSILTIKTLNTVNYVPKYSQVRVAKLLTTTQTVCSKDIWGRTKCSTVESTRAPLKRSLRLDPVKGEPIYFSVNGVTREVDISKMIGLELKVILGETGADFYLKR